MKTKELKQALRDILTAKRELLEVLKGKENPQVKELYSRTDAEINAFLSVLDALNNNDMLIKCYLPRKEIAQ